MTIESNLKALRAKLDHNGIDALIIPRADEYLGEYVPAHNERLKFISGFTGSAGILVVTQQQAALFVDGRYTLQASEQCPAPLFEHHHLIEDPVLPWLAKTLLPGQKVAVDSRVVTYRFFKQAEVQLGTADIMLEGLAYNVLDDLWENRPKAPSNPGMLYADSYAGESSASKRGRIADLIKAAGADAAIVNQLDAIAWLLNIRGTDVPHLPVILSQSILGKDGALQLFIAPEKLPEGFADHVGEKVTVFPETGLAAALTTLGDRQAKILFDSDQTNAFSALTCLTAGCELIEQANPVDLPKAQKNDVEIAGIRAAHIRDGAALCQFLCWLDGEIAAGRYLDEAQLSDQLEAFRRALPELQDLSFGTISAAGNNAAMAHYSHTNGTPAKLTPNSLYLVDSGGQYFDGTTDVTRTIAIDDPRPDHKTMFTRVLKGHIALACANFPNGIQGQQIDALARQFLWEIGKDFDHGTGHGVGCYLSVHEGPQRIGKAAGPTAPLLPGMVLSNEPGYYEPEDYGIRCENLMTVISESNGMLGFETLTFAPFDRRLIETELLTSQELNWLNDYHAEVFDKIGPLLDQPTHTWLSAATAPIGTH